MYKPKIFIASSTEGLKLAEVVAENLKTDNFADCVIWNEVSFSSNQPTIEWIIQNVNKGNFDFAIMVLTADDKTEFRGEEVFAPRDNVLFEMGLFINKLGKERVFLIYNMRENIKIPSDLFATNDYRFNSAVPIKDLKRSELKNNFDLKEKCDSIKEQIKALNKFTPQDDLLEREIGALYRILNALTTPAFPHIDRKFLRRLSKQLKDESFSDISDVINFAKEIIDDFLKPHFSPEEHVRIYFSYFLGDGLEIRNKQISKCVDIKENKDGSEELFEGRFVVGFSYSNSNSQDKWLYGNILSCYYPNSTEHLSNCARGFQNISFYYIPDTEDERNSNHYVKNEKSVYSVPVRLGIGQNDRASLGVLAISHSKTRAISDDMREKTEALSIVLGYIFKLYAKNIDDNDILGVQLPNGIVYGVNKNSPIEFKKKVVLIRRNIAKYFEDRFLDSDRHILKNVKGESKLYTERAWKKRKISA
jgi:hypothetical protein